MKCIKPFCIALALGGVSSNANSFAADDNFILQPKIKQETRAVEPKPTDAAAQSVQNVVVQPQRPVNPVATSGNAPVASHVVLQTEDQSDFVAAPANREPDGLTWVRRGTIGNSPPATAESPAARFTTVEVATPVMAKAQLPVASVTRVPHPQPAQVDSSLDRSVTHNNSAPVQLTGTSESASSKFQLASKISQRIIGDYSNDRYLAERGSPLVGPAAIERQLNESLAQSEYLCGKGVFLSAREEAITAMLKLARYLDGSSGKFASEPAIESARTALQEAQDFLDPKNSSILPELVRQHVTPVLKRVDLANLPPATLAQAYYQHAETMLLDGAKQHPWFSDIYYTLGRTYQAEADNNTGSVAERLRVQAVVLYRAAASIRPNNSLATNQLGFVLLQLDRPTEAQVALIASVDTKLEAPALQNLAEASRRVGDRQMQDWALSMIPRVSPPPTSNHQAVPEVLELDNVAFRATTPIIPIRSSQPLQTASAPLVQNR